MSNDLPHLLLETGLLQFGWFEGGQVPFQLNLALIPSYPDVLHWLVAAAAPLVGEVDHLVSAAPALPLGVGLSLNTGIPLVYSRGTDDAPVHDFVGAYDIGHPTLLLANDLRDTSGLVDLAKRAGHVGLEIKRLLVIVDDGTFHPATMGVECLLYLPSLVNDLVETDQLPAGHGAAVQRWLQAHKPDQSSSRLSSAINASCGTST